MSGLANALKNRPWMYINGVILVSPTDIGIDRDGPVKDANQLPYFAAAAWYHDALPEDLQSKDLLDVLAEVEDYTFDTYLPALAQGTRLSEQQQDRRHRRCPLFWLVKRSGVIQ